MRTHNCYACIKSAVLGLRAYFRKITHSIPYKWSLTTLSVNEIYPYGCVQMKSCEPCSVPLLWRSFYYLLLCMFLLLFKAGDVFLAVLSVQRHVFVRWISLMLVTNTNKCLFVILLCRHHWNRQCSYSLLLTLIRLHWILYVQITDIATQQNGIIEHVWT